MVDDRILIDPGPDAPARIAAAGRALDRVELLLVTHAHPDHFDPAILLARSWAEQHGNSLPELTVAGPPSAVAAARAWLAPDATVQFVALEAGQTMMSGTTLIRALPAAHSLGGGAEHDGTALLYELLDPAGNILWATDTAALPHRHLAGPYDLVALEETFGDAVGHGTAHLDLPGFAAEVAQLRAGGLLAPGAVVVAVHLSHHNPPDLAQRLAGVGASVVADLTTLTIPGPPVEPERPARTLLTGGARSGKSWRAEELARSSGARVVYVATAPSYPDDPQWAARIAAHRERRPAGWPVHETADVAGELDRAGAGDLILVDCLTLWLTAVLDGAGVWDDPEAARTITAASSAELVRALGGCRAQVVLVTNEVGSGIVPEHASGRVFRDLMGQVNAQVAAACDRVEMLVCGVPVPLTEPARRP